MAIQADLARELLDRHPDITSHAAARVLLEQHPEVYVTHNAARCAVRGVRGAKGRDNGTTVTHPRSAEDADRCRTWGELIQDPDPSGWREHELPADVERWLWLSDVHMPFHDKPALTLAMEHGVDTRCDGVLLMGDILDFYQFSDFTRDPRCRAPVEEWLMFLNLIDGINEKLKPKRVVWKPGNHEDRWPRYMMTRAPMMWAMDGMRFEERREIVDRGVIVIGSRHGLRVGKLNLRHGHELPKGITNPESPAKTALDKANACIIVGHWHKTTEHAKRAMDGSIMRGFSVGCLCDLRPEYCPDNQWNHGMAVIETQHGGMWRVSNRQIIKGEVV